MSLRLESIFLLISLIVVVSTFRVSTNAARSFRQLTVALKLKSEDRNDDLHTSITRRGILAAGASIGLSGASRSWALDDFKAARRPTAYRVDSTIPPTLLPLNAAEERRILGELGRGSGTDKEAVVVDTINLNNMLNKAVFGTINTVTKVVGSKAEESRFGPGSATFVCLGVPSDTKADDIDLATSLLSDMMQVRKSKQSALGLWFCPYSTQSRLDLYSTSGSEEDLVSALRDSGISDSTINIYMPVFRFAKRNSLDLLAMSPEYSDRKVAGTQGLQNIEGERRSAYVVDPEGFIELSRDPKFKLYTERSLLKDFSPLGPEESSGNFFAERILTHEAGATSVSRYAMKRPESLVAIIAPIRDVRYLGGINGRIPRICKFLNAESKVSNNSVTTILVNPTSSETLSKSRYLRLEIGTGPDTLDYQTKIADYLWFSSIPKVNMIPRLMA